MKRMLGIFALSKSEQRVVLIVMLTLIAVALLGYERRVHQFPAQSAAATESKTSPSPARTDDDP
jgi:hypothetical protein